MFFLVSPTRKNQRNAPRTSTPPPGSGFLDDSSKVSESSSSAHEQSLPLTPPWCAESIYETINTSTGWAFAATAGGGPAEERLGGVGFFFVTFFCAADKRKLMSCKVLNRMY